MKEKPSRAVLALAGLASLDFSQAPPSRRAFALRRSFLKAGAIPFWRFCSALAEAPGVAVSITRSLLARAAVEVTHDIRAAAMDCGFGSFPRDKVENMLNVAPPAGVGFKFQP